MGCQIYKPMGSTNRDVFSAGSDLLFCSWTRHWNRACHQPL